MEMWKIVQRIGVPLGSVSTIVKIVYLPVDSHPSKY